MYSVPAIIFDILLFVVWPGNYIYQEFLSSRRHRQRRSLKMIISQTLYRIRWDRDRLTTKQQETLTAVSEEARQRLDKPPEAKETNAFLETAVKRIKQTVPKHKYRRSKEILELLVVVIGVVMGIRALFLQPFKIPTGSMQPTLSGIHFTVLDEVDVAWWEKVLHYTNGSRRYVDVTASQSARVWHDPKRGMVNDRSTQKNMLIFFPYTVWRHSNASYTLPGTRDIVGKYLATYRIEHYPEDYLNLKSGERLARGYLELGDHLFVNRSVYNFMEPKRGDITVFTTDDLLYERQPLRGRFYIKRLVGIPGDTLRIRDSRLYVTEAGSDTEVAVDDSFGPAFDRIYSFKGGYRGYSYAGFLASGADEVTLGVDEYWLMGDNSENSLDSRFWGPVPRRNIVGRADFVYWPFTRRWGRTDLAEPLDLESPPTRMPGIKE